MGRYGKSVSTTYDADTTSTDNTISIASNSTELNSLTAETSFMRDIILANAASITSLQSENIDLTTRISALESDVSLLIAAITALQNPP
jgi:hypothetical protein